MDEPDPVTIRAAIDGDLDAFEELVRALQVPVFRFVRGLTGDVHLAEDLTQETFIRVHRALPSFAFRARFSTWTFQIARNAALDARRTQGRRDRLVGQLRTLDRGRPARPDASARVELQAALDDLRPKHREALLAVEVLGLSYRDAAQVLEVPEGTVKSRVAHGREQLARWMAAVDEGGAADAR